METPKRSPKKASLMNEAERIVTEGVAKALKLSQLYHDLALTKASELCMWAICTGWPNQDNIVYWAICQEHRQRVEAEIKLNLPY